MDPKISDQYKGYLYKWTNYLKGYQKRYFILQNGLLSYYRNQAEMAHTCRGTINLASATVHGGDGCTFVISNSGGQTFHLKASSEIEQKKWITVLSVAKTKAMALHENDEDPVTTAEQDKKGVEDFLCCIDCRLGDLNTCQELLQRKGDDLLKSVNEFENAKEGPDVMNRFHVVRERATVFKVAALAMVNSCAEFTRFTSEQSHKWHKMLSWEREQRQRLEQMVEELAKQHSSLEKKVQTQTAHSTKGDDKDSSEEDFFDAPDAVEGEGFNVRLPTDDFEMAEVMDEYESDVDSEEESTESGVRVESTMSTARVREARVVTKRHAKDVSATSTSEKRRESAGATFSQSEALITIRPKRQRRTEIPPKPNISINLWSILKNCIGKELTKIPMPVNFSEPLSMLQRLTEDYEFSECLDKAAQCQDSIEQMAYVAAFSVSAYASTSVRTNKPFNPLLGETFECDRTDDLGWRSLAEQVSHHPPVAALHCESREWHSWQEFSMTSKFRGKYMQILPQGTAHLVFRRSGNHYTWQKVPLTVHNIIVGKLWIDNSGDMDIVNHTTGEKCHLSFKPYSYFSSDVPRRVTGTITGSAGVVRYVLNGTWDDHIKGMPVIAKGESIRGKPVLETGPVKILWKRPPLIPNSERMYNFTRLAVQLNEQDEGVAPTDCRLRPDQRLMELGRWDDANREKVRLEEKQRARRRARSASEPSGNEEDRGKEEEHNPLWFKPQTDPSTNSSTHLFTGKYWECKQEEDWQMCPNIY